MTRLIALMLIAAGTVAAITADIQPGQAFELVPDLAEPLLTQKLAKLADAPLAPPSKARAVQVRLLVDSSHGKINDVVSLPAIEAKQLEAGGLADSNKAAVAYALTLAQNT